MITNPRPILLACLAAVAALGVCNSAAARDGKTQDDKTQEEKAQEEKPQVDKGNKNKNEKPYGDRKSTRLNSSH